MKRIVHSILFSNELRWALLVLLFISGSVVSVQSQEPVLIEDWGFIGNRTAGWGITHGEPGNVTLSGDTSMTSGWSAIRGEFPAVTLGEGEALNVTGQIHFEGEGPHRWNAMRYGVFRHDSTGTLFNEATDSAFWGRTLYEGTDSAQVVPSPEGFAYGYLIMTMSGVNERATWGIGGAGDLGAVYGGSWISTFGAGSSSLGLVDQRLFRAEPPEGLYDYAISVHTQDDGYNQVRFYLIHEDGEYWYGGVVIDTTGVPTDTFNGVTFGLNADSDDMTAVHFMDIAVQVGAPLTLPNPPLETPPHAIGRIMNENRTFELSSPGLTTGEPFWYFAAGNTLNVEIVSDDAQTGLRSLMFEFDNTLSGNSWDIEAVNEPVHPAAYDIVRASVWLKADSDARVANLYLGLPGDCDFERVADYEVTLTEEWALYQIPDYTVSPQDAACTMRFGIELNFEENVGGVIMLDNAIVRKVGEFDPTRITKWGFLGGRRAGWDVEVGEPGYVTLSGDEPLTSGWSAIRGEFHAPLTPGEGEAVVVMGQINFEGEGPHRWNAMRYGIFRHDSTGTVEYAGTDSARWTGPENHAYGYLIMTMSGVNERATWGIGGAGDLGAVYGGSWISTFGAGSSSLGLVDQRLFRAEPPEGLYDYAISVHAQEDGNNQVRFYLIHEDGEYWYGGVVIDTTGGPTNTFNGVTFGLNADSDDMTAVHFMDITATVGPPLMLPPPPLEIPEHDIGRILNENRTFELASPGITTGELYWTFSAGGGSDAVFEIITEDAQTGLRALKVDFGTWNGTSNIWEVEAVSEPFYPAIGDIIRATTWLKADEDGRIARIYLGLPDSGGWQRVPDWNMEVVCTLTTEWQMFTFPEYTVIARDVTHADESMRFGIEMNLEVNDGGAIYIDNTIVRKVGAVSVEERPGIPLVYTLEQNYPNPFNPTTQIQFAIPERADVVLEVFDILGRRVATLINNENYPVGVHTVTWNATNQAGLKLSSGMYIYRLQAGSFVQTKRMMLIK
jgi:hypothetical protein